MNKSQCKIKNNCIYWLDANKIENYFGITITKKRPFICAHIEHINNKQYYYFIGGTSKKITEIKNKNFKNYFLKLETNPINNLDLNTHFQTNSIYIIDNESIEKFFIKYIGRLCKNENLNLKNYFIKIYNDEIYWLNYWSEHFNRWVTVDYGKNFLYIASRHKKKAKQNKIIIGKILKPRLSLQNLDKKYKYLWKQISNNFKKINLI